MHTPKSAISEKYLPLCTNPLLLPHDTFSPSNDAKAQLRVLVVELLSTSFIISEITAVNNYCGVSRWFLFFCIGSHKGTALRLPALIPERDEDKEKKTKNKRCIGGFSSCMGLTLLWKPDIPSSPMQNPKLLSDNNGSEPRTVVSTLLI